MKDYGFTVVSPRVDRIILSIRSRVEKIVGWLNCHWEWYFAIATGFCIYFIATHIQTAAYFYVGIAAIFIPLLFLLLWSFPMLFLKRVQLVKCLAGWMGYVCFWALIIGREPSGNTLEEVIEIRTQEILTTPPLIAWMTGALLAIIPVVLIMRTRHARLNAIASKYDLVFSEEAEKLE